MKLSRKGSKNGSFIIFCCRFCKKETKCHSRSRKYCSRKCYELNKRRYSVCPVCKVNFRNTRGRKTCSRVCGGRSWVHKKGYKTSFEVRKKISDSQKGEKGHNWKGGVTPLQKKERKTIEYRLWREQIFQRDKWTCQFCLKRGGELQADHIKSYVKYPDLRLDLNNGRTLCVSCHKKTPTYARNRDFQT